MGNVGRIPKNSRRLGAYFSSKMSSILITDAGWGDSGKGKIVSAFKPDIGAKIIGGHNAGHTVVTDKGELGLGLLPSSVVYPKTINIIGQEVVINPAFLLQELEKLKKFGVSLSQKRLLLDTGSHLIFPWHEIRDALSEEARGKQAVGSLHLGVGWTYSDRINRRGLRISDILPNNWRDNVKKEFINQHGVIDDMRRDVKRKTGRRSRVKTKLDEGEILKIVKTSRPFFQKYAANTKEIIWKAIDKNAEILFEDSHGAMLDVSHGSWPFTTGVNTGLGALYRSFGGKALKSIEKIIVVTKAYQTRVGGGPMPTENFGRFGNFVREKGGEVGTRSGRARRCGAIDIPLLSYGMNILGLSENDEVALTKLDVLSGLSKIPVCCAYKYKGKKYKIAPSADAQFLEKVKPVYTYLKGWKEDISNVRKFVDLPNEAKKYILFVQKFLNPKITMIGVGKHKDAVMLL